MNTSLFNNTIFTLKTLIHKEDAIIQWKHPVYENAP